MVVAQPAKHMTSIKSGNSLTKVDLYGWVKILGAESVFTFCRENFKVKLLEEGKNWDQKFIITSLAIYQKVWLKPTIDIDIDIEDKTFKDSGSKVYTVM